ncbi:transmembrane protein 135-like isoform X1 [Lineus longissimus]|uniref:transmembrane protein 135-like isoform X1 n=2 Tax=Lineus longissimus TaxID=88925 RepID=UPI002B4CB7F7
MAAYSKFLTHTCYELGHTWTPSCLQASKDIAIYGLKHSFKIYAPLYIISAILRRKGFDYYLKKLMPEILQSTVFLGTNAFSFIASFCLWRKVLGGVYITSAFLPALCASFIAISLERKSRRGLLAVYISTIATEMIINMLMYRKILPPVKNAEVLLFSCVMAVYMFLFRMKDGLQGSTLSAIRFLVGSSELPQSVKEKHQPSSKKVQFNLDLHQSKSAVAKILEVCLQRVRSFPKHRLCPHQHSCLSYTLGGCVRMFASGFAIQGAIHLLGSLPVLFKRPKAIVNAIKHRDNFYCGAFLASFSGLFRGVSCLLRWLRNSDSELHALISGFIAGWSMLWYRSQSIALYSASKLLEVLYMKGIDAGHLPSFRHADTVLYAIATSLVFHAAVFEPHTLRPAYWKFLTKLTNGKFGEMNRRLLDVYGTEASKAFPDFWPVYDTRYTKLQKPIS